MSRRNSSFRNYRQDRRLRQLNISSYISNLHDNSSSSTTSSASTNSNIFEEDNIQFESSSGLSSPSLESEFDMDVEPSSKDYFEAVFLTMLSHAGLTINAAEIVINLFNSTSKRYSFHPLIFPSIRHFWHQQSKDNIVNFYVLCENGHSHGPFDGGIKNNESYQCCGETLTVNLQQDDYFIHLPLKSQFEKFLPSIPQDSWQEDKDSIQEPDDVSNAKLARSVRFITKEDIIKLTLTIHADEVSCSKSSSNKILPIFISINELKPLARRKFFFLSGLYVGKNKPAVEIFLGPLCDELQSLAENPLDIQITGRIGNKITFHLIALIADAPMRAYLRNVRQFNHLNGCDWCLVQATSANGARVYANLTRAEIKTISRKKKDFLDFKVFLESDQFPDELNIIQNPRFKGLNGVSPLLLLTDFDIVQGVSVEPMHAIVLGVFRNFLLKGIINNNITNLYDRNINKTLFINKLGNNLINIKVTSETTRITRDLEQIKFWKSNEFDSLLVYFMYTSARGLLKNSVFNYICCLARIYFLSHKGPVTQMIVQEIDNLVEEFQIGTAALFGTGFLTYNLHIMSHLSSSLCNLGPNSNVSSYPLEDHMGQLKDKVRRYSHIGPSLLRVFLNDFKFYEFCQVKMRKWNLSQKEKKNFGIKSMSDYTTKIPLQRVSSTFKSKILDLINRSQHNLIVQSNELEFYKTIYVRGIRYSTNIYCNNKKRNDSIITTGDKDFFRIIAIVTIRQKNVFLCRKFKTKPVALSFKGFSGFFSFSLDHIFEAVEKDQTLYVIDFNYQQKCLFVPSTVFQPIYKCDHIIKPFLHNK